MQVSFGKFVPIVVKINGNDKPAYSMDRDNVAKQLCVVLKNPARENDLTRQQQTAFRLGIGSGEYVVPSKNYNSKNPTRSNVEPLDVGGQRYLLTGDSIDFRDREGRTYNPSSGVQLGLSEQYTLAEQCKHDAGQIWLKNMQEALRTQRLGKTLVVQVDKVFDARMKPVYTIKHLDFCS